MFNLFYVFFEDGSSVKVEYPLDWTVEDVMKANNCYDVMGPYPIEE